MAISRVRRTGCPRPSARTLWTCPPSFPHVTYATHAPSGDHEGWNSPSALDAMRRGSPPGSSITYRSPNAEKAMRVPSGDGTASRIWRATIVGVSSMGYWNFTSGPMATSTSMLNGIFAGALPSTGTRQISPP